MDGFMAVTKALADQNRVRTLMALRAGELYVCHIIEFLGLAPSTVSRHMSMLRQAGLVKGRKQGRWMYYRLPGKDAPQQVRSAIFLLRRSLEDNHVILRDNELIAKIIRTHEEDQCQTEKK